MDNLDGMQPGEYDRVSYYSWHNGRRARRSDKARAFNDIDERCRYSIHSASFIISAVLYFRFRKLIEGWKSENGERAGEELEIVNRQLSSFILVDGSIYLLPGLFVSWPAVTAFALFTAVGWNRSREKTGSRKELFSYKKKKKRKRAES